MSDERVVRDRQVGRIRRRLGDTIARFEEWHAILDRRSSPMAFRAHAAIREEDPERRYQAPLRTCPKPRALLLSDSATAGLADRWHGATFSLIGAFPNANARAQGSTGIAGEPSGGVRTLRTSLQRTAVGAQEVLVSNEPPLPA